MSIEDAFRRGILEYYRNQRGKGFPVYRGAELQYGRGLGDILRSIAKFIIPIFAPAASKFITSAATGINEGKSLKEAAKGALQPTMGEAMSAAGSQIMSRIGQRGSGRRGYIRRAPRRRTTKKRQPAKKRKTATKRKAAPKKPRFTSPNF